MLYLCTYYEYKNKNVSRAAKSVINYVREYNPALLSKKFRGKVNHGGDEEVQGHGEGEGEESKKDATWRIPGVEYLEHNGQLPVQMDRILTDEDFKKMKKMVKKKEEERSWGNTFDNQIQG